MIAEVEAAGSVEVTFATTQSWLGTELWVEVDPYDLVEECYEDDNIGTYGDVPCE